MPRISQINKFPEEEKIAIYSLLIPPSLFSRIETRSGVSRYDDGRFVFVRLCCPPGTMEMSLEVTLESEPDPLFLIELSDSKDYVQLQWDFINVNDPDSARFATDVDPSGGSRWLNWAGRNIPEEVRALEAGLAPGQTRRGLKLMREINLGLDKFCRAVGLKSIALEALFYHTAVHFERHGYRYFKGHRMMSRIHELFQPGGKLYNKLDCSTPFRRPEFANTVRGRSWAIHDYVLDEINDPIVDMWEPPLMYRMVGERHVTETFPGACY